MTRILSINTMQLYSARARKPTQTKRTPAVTPAVNPIIFATLKLTPTAADMATLSIHHANNQEVLVRLATLEKKKAVEEALVKKVDSLKKKVERGGNADHPEELAAAKTRDLAANDLELEEKKK